MEISTAWLITTPPSRTFSKRVEDEVGKGLFEGAAGKCLEAFVQTLVDRGNGGGREGMAAEFLGDRLDLPGRDALHVHLGQSRHERLFGALITLEELSLPIPTKPGVTG